MSEATNVQNVQVDETVKAANGARKPRKQAVTGEVYLAALKEGAASTPKKTAQQVADGLGMTKASFDQRLNKYRQDWQDYRFVTQVKTGATAETLKMTQAEFDEKLEKVKENGNYDLFKDVTPEMVKTYAGPFPWVLADGRSTGESTKGSASHNAILAALNAAE